MDETGLSPELANAESVGDDRSDVDLLDDGLPARPVFDAPSPLQPPSLRAPAPFSPVVSPPASTGPSFDRHPDERPSPDFPKVEPLASPPVVVPEPEIVPVVPEPQTQPAFGRHLPPSSPLRAEAAEFGDPYDAIPPPEGVTQDDDVVDRINREYQRDREAFALAESILSAEEEAQENNRPASTENPEHGDDAWFGGLTREDNPVYEDDTEEVKPNPVAEVDGRPHIESYLTWMVDNNGSDLHLVEGEVPRCRIFGALKPIPHAPVETKEHVEVLVAELLTDRQAQIFAESNEMDSAYSMSEDDGASLTSRFRVNVFVSMDRMGVVARVIPTRIKTLDELGILPQIKGLSKLPRGLVLVTGPTGSGKSTTLAGIVDLINISREERLFTFEDPIEFTHTSKRCMISHREVGTDTMSFPAGLKAVRREDPDIILIGEMRDNETIKAAIEAADTGHLVLATLHTSSAYETVGRIINTFPEEEQNQVRVTLASVLKAVVCQTLVPSSTSEMGRVVASEVMMVTPGIQNNIRENDLPAIRNALSDQTHGSIGLDAHLAQLIREGKITKREALKKCTDPKNLNRQLGDNAGSDR